jgi:hypothetical protein
MLLRKQGKLIEARALLEQAIRHQQAALNVGPERATYRQFLCNHYIVLTKTLLDLGEHTRAAEAAEQVPRFSSTALQDYFASANVLQYCIALAEKDAKLSVDQRQALIRDYAARCKKLLAKFLSHKLAAAAFCQSPGKHLYVTAARLYTEAFAAQPGLADKIDSGHRYNAACAAALAGCKKGRDAARLKDNERVRLRQQALDWLKDDLRAWAQLLDAQPDKGGPTVARQLAHWLEDADFAGVRGQQALAKLPAAERQAWQKLWADVAHTLARAERKAIPARKPDSK